MTNHQLRHHLTTARILKVKKRRKRKRLQLICFFSFLLSFLSFFLLSFLPHYLPLFFFPIFLFFLFRIATHVFTPPKISKGTTTSIYAFLSKKKDKTFFFQENRVNLFLFFRLYAKNEVHACMGLAHKASLATFLFQRFWVLVCKVLFRHVIVHSVYDVHSDFSTSD
jgi:hypothetical protein